MFSLFLFTVFIIIVIYFLYQAGLLLTGLERCLSSPQMTLRNQFQQVIAIIKVNYEKVIAKMKLLSSQEIKVSFYNIGNF